jgi:hypothetical protein
VCALEHIPPEGALCLCGDVSLADHGAKSTPVDVRGSTAVDLNLGRVSQSQQGDKPERGGGGRMFLPGDFWLRTGRGGYLDDGYNRVPHRKHNLG